MIGPDTAVWLNGRLGSEHYLMDRESGEVLKLLRSLRRTTAGIGQPCGGRFVAVYLEPPDGERTILQIGSLKYPLDGQTITAYRDGFGGLWARLRVERPGCPTIDIWQSKIRRAIGLLNPFADPFVPSVTSDFLTVVNATARSEEWRTLSHRWRDPNAGPWDVLNPEG